MNTNETTGNVVRNLRTTVSLSEREREVLQAITSGGGSASAFLGAMAILQRQLFSEAQGRMPGSGQARLDVISAVLRMSVALPSIFSTPNPANTIALLSGYEVRTQRQLIDMIAMAVYLAADKGERLSWEAEESVLRNKLGRGIKTLGRDDQ